MQCNNWGVMQRAQEYNGAHRYCRRSRCTGWPAAMRRANRGLSRPWTGAPPRCWGCAGFAMRGGSCIGSPASTANLHGHSGVRRVLGLQGQMSY